ncbi:hypothetical protein SORBI_3004G189000 [Sorghum bicolor]|uniref:Uncharacterized protein n=1 Tax=Sorghum bicolor TaxID=4558 RepID=A0A194YQI4_SORBI|nr:hypothetical protein SORBI_3004G189000 [Sorghum bicolor]
MFVARPAPWRGGHPSGGGSSPQRRPRSTSNLAAGLLPCSKRPHTSCLAPLLSCHRRAAPPPSGWLRPLPLPDLVYRGGSGG